MAITIGWRSQQISQVYDSRCTDRHWSIGVGYLDEIRTLTCWKGTKCLPSGATGCHLEETETNLV